MLPEPSFNSAAHSYDTGFTNTMIGRLQRGRVRLFLRPYISGAAPLSILEINCGTGEDALWLASLGHHVTATDAADEMIEVAKQKLLPPTSKGTVNWITAAFNELGSLLPGEKFDLIFSNFSGLNCVDKATLKELNTTFASMLNPGGKLVAVLFGKECWLEEMLDTWHGSPASRRALPQEIPVDNDHRQCTYYYSCDELAEIFTAFELLEKKPVGLFIPPSYMEPRMKPVYLPMLRTLESFASHDASLADYGDHIFIAFERR